MHLHGAFSMTKNARRVFWCVNRAFYQYQLHFNSNINRNGRFSLI
nr:MAG TPA: hypothetical protein [Caudoviricetes sp.]